MVVHVPVRGCEVAPLLNVAVALTVALESGTKPFPSPRFWLTVTVNVCGVPAGFVTFSGEIWICASTNVLTASVLSPDKLSPVARVIDWPATLTVVEAWTATCPAVVLLTTIVHWPFESVTLFVHEPDAACEVAPLL